MTSLPPRITIHVPDRNERDRVLGQYMDTFSRMETGLRSCIQELLGVSEVQAQAVVASTFTANMIDLFAYLAETTLKPKGAKRAGEIAEKLRTRNRLRNRIVHGIWRCHVLNPETGEAIWIRYYLPTDWALVNLPLDHPKIEGHYAFTVPVLSRTTSLLEPMVGTLMEFLQEIPPLRLTGPPDAAED